MAKVEKAIEESVVIPTDGNTITRNAFQSNSSLINIVIREGVTEIGEAAFWKCENLESVTFPSTLKKIGIEAFSKCKNLKEVSLPDGLQEIGRSAFSECTSLTEFRFPDSVACNESYLRGCHRIKKVILPKKMTEMPYDFLSGLDALEEIVFPEELKVIGSDALENCTSLVSIELPESVEVLEFGAFSNCKKLTSIKLPKHLKKIYKRAFYGCDKLKEVELFDVEEIYRDSFPEKIKLKVSHDSKTLKEEDGLLLSADGKVLRACLKSAETIEIPESVTEIFDYAFERMPLLTTITLGKNLVKLDKSCFNGCPSLQKVYFEGRMVEIGESAFYNCQKLDTVSFPYPDSIASIGSNAFTECTKLKSITIPASVGTVGEDAFRDTGLSQVTIHSKGALGNGVFSYCRFKQIEIPSHTIGLGAFSGCDKLTSVTLLDSVSIIERAAFQECPKLTTIHIAALNRNADTKTFLDRNATEAIQLDGPDKSWMGEQDDELAQMRKTAEEGDIETQYKLGGRYYKGDGLPESHELAIEWWTKAAKQGHVKAQFNLGLCYSKGDGVSQNKKKAAEWYAKAAEQGNANAQNNLGVLYEDGEGVPQNYEMAAEWFRKSEALGNEQAKKNLKRLQEEGLIVSDNTPKITDDTLGTLYYKENNGWMGSSTANFSRVEMPFEVELEGTEKEGVTDAQRKAFVEYEQRKESYFETLQQKAQDLFIAAHKKKNNRILPAKLYIARDGNYGWIANKEWDGKEIVVILSDEELLLADDKAILQNAAEVKSNRTKTEWHIDDTVYFNLFGVLTILSIRTPDGKDGELLSDKEKELLMWLTQKFDSNKIKKEVLKYCNDSYDSWGGDTITADDLHEELSLNYIRIRVEKSDWSDKEPDICLSGDCGCDEEHGIAIAFRDKKLIDIEDESIAF
ncbi:MAG: leucine-rich repeat protein [Paludibacteraceae bacterium]|nr:leucine-rich repeat protein [Paludibacteraceae bacterium]